MKLVKLTDAVAALAVIVALVVIVGGAIEAIVNTDHYAVKAYFDDLKIILLGLSAVLLALHIARVRIPEPPEPDLTTYRPPPKEAP
jgi:hypothetical protein